MLSDLELENVYKANINLSHYAGLRGVFDAGYAVGAGLTAAQAAGDSSQNASVTDATVAADATADVTQP